MKIRVKGFYNFDDIIKNRGVLELEADGMTIRQLLARLSAKFGNSFRDMIYDGEGSTDKLISLILVNGINIRNLAGNLDAELNDGDLVNIFPPMAGG